MEWTRAMFLGVIEVADYEYHVLFWVWPKCFVGLFLSVFFLQVSYLHSHIDFLRVWHLHFLAGREHFRRSVGRSATLRPHASVSFHRFRQSEIHKLKRTITLSKIDKYRIPWWQCRCCDPRRGCSRALCLWNEVLEKNSKDVKLEKEMAVRDLS